MTGPGALLIAVRALHYASTVQLAGLFAFLLVIGGPALAATSATAAAVALLRQLRALAWTSLALAVLSGAAWLALETAAMSDEPFRTALSDGSLSTVLVETRFGQDWLVRAGLALLLALLLLAPGLARSRAVGKLPAWRLWALLGTAAALLGSLAWAGHGAATSDAAGSLHLAADIIHLLAVGTWIGGLLPLALLLGMARRRAEPAWTAAAATAARRFSGIGYGAVAAVIMTGIVNAFFLIDGPAALLSTAYGRVLIMKLALVALILAVAAVNRFHLAPQLAAGTDQDRVSLRRLCRNCWLEAALGLAILSIVAALGLLPPPERHAHFSSCGQSCVTVAGSVPLVTS